MEEIWKSISDFEGYYEVSNCGNVRSVDRVLWNGRCYHLKRGRTLKLSHDAYGYLFVNISKDNKITAAKVHRLVAAAFIPNPENKREVNHINGIKTDNTVTNIEWCTSSENKIHAYRVLGKVYANPMVGRFGKLHHSAIPLQQLTMNNVLVKTWESIRQAETEGGFDERSIHRCLRGKYKHHKGFIWKTAA